jgi:hypothetical protein
VKRTSYEAPHYAVFSSLPPVPASYTKVNLMILRSRQLSEPPPLSFASLMPKQHIDVAVVFLFYNGVSTPEIINVEYKIDHVMRTERIEEEIVMTYFTVLVLYFRGVTE